VIIDVTSSLAFFLNWNGDKRERWLGFQKLRGYWCLNLYWFTVACSHPWGKK
jgi:hypothetical protein